MYSFLPFPRAIHTRHVVFIESNLFVGLLTVSSRIYVVRLCFLVGRKLESLFRGKTFTAALPIFVLGILISAKP